MISSSEARIQPVPAARDEIPGPASPKAPSPVRPMRREDIDAVAQMFMRTFRDSDQPPSDALKAYLELVCFGSPAYEPDVGSIVHAGADGRVRGAITITPIRFVCGDRVYPGRELANYMVEDPSAKQVASELALVMRARSQDFAFSETARPVSADMVRAMGAVVLPIQSLEWVRIFQPAGTVVRLAARRGGIAAKLPLGGVAGLVDRLATRVVPKLAPLDQGVSFAPASREEFLEHAPQFVAHYHIHPEWTAPELGWLLDRASERTRNGALTLVKVISGDRIVGLGAWLGGPGMIANVLNILARKNRERDVVPAVMAALAAQGNAAARGTAQPLQIDWLYRVPGMIFRHNAYAYVISRHPDIVDALRRNDVYLGGLAGEGWSRLVSEQF